MIEFPIKILPKLSTMQLKRRRNKNRRMNNNWMKMKEIKMRPMKNQSISSETSSKTNYLEKENSARRLRNSKRQYKEPSTIWKTFRHQITSQIIWFQRTTILEILGDMISQDHWETRLSAALAILWVSFSQLRLEWS